MVVSFSVGKNSTKVINTLKKTADNVSFFSYKSIHELVKEASSRHLDFQRIIFSTSILEDVEKDLNELNTFISKYSVDTEIVMLMPRADSGEDKVFNSIFNSPLYTPVILATANPKNLLELVQEDIMKLNTKYYALDKEDAENTSSFVAEEKTDENEESGSVESSTSDSVSNPISSAPVGFSGFSSGPASVSNINSIFNTDDTTSTEERDVNNTSNFSDGLPVADSSNFNGKDSSTVDEEDNLSIGSFGSQHTDTGFLDADEDEELQAYLESHKTESEPVNTETRNYSVHVDIPKVEKQKAVKEKEPVNVNRNGLPNIDLIISTRGNSATQSIVDQAVEIATKDSARVLIIDLDVKENNLLSFINTEEYYRQNAQEGISKQRVYSEDGVSIVSNGYGSKLTSRHISTFLDSRVSRDYDMIYIDCPADCLHLLTKDLISLCNVILFMNGDRGSLVSISLALTDRSVVSLDVERYIMENCLVDIETEYTQEDIDFITSSCLFANGSWVQRLDM